MEVATEKGRERRGPDVDGEFEKQDKRSTPVSGR